MIVHLLNFNNYYNRTYKPLSSNDDYQQYIVYIPDNDVNFNPNDGVNTVLVMNMPSIFDDKANYLVTVENGEITSRWFIIDAERTRLNQYQMTLRRDLLADYFEDITTAPTFIEKAKLKYGNPLLFNSEDMTFNQIKTKETPLRDRSLCPWIVGYIDRTAANRTISVPTQAFYAETYDAIEDLPYYTETVDGKFKAARQESFGLTIGYIDFETGFFGYSSTFNKGGAIDHTRGFLENNIEYRRIQTAGDYKSNAKEAWAAVANAGSAYISANLATFNSYAAEATGIQSESRLNAFLKEYSTQARTVKIGNQYYKVRRDEGTATTKRIKAAKGTNLYNYIDTMVDGISALHKIPSFQDFSDNYMFDYTELTYTLYIEEAAISASYRVDIPSTGVRRHLQDAPYDMFCIPYNYNSKLSVGYIHNGNYGRTIINCDAVAAMSLATQMAAELGTQLYDIQLLPYCPIQGVIDTVGSIAYDTSQYADNVDVCYIYDTTLDPNDPNQASIMFWCSKSEFSLNIDKTHEQHPNGGYTNRAIDILVDEADAKVQALCDMYRLVSPNYNGQFEFNPVKNNGVDYFTVDATYKPYSPYIRVAPNFKGLYGGDFDDARGLICGGDFSLPTLTDQWKEYEINNKNYLNAFNRQIENMEINNKYQRIGEMFGAAAGTIGGSVSGASTGFIASGSPYGAAAGAVVGGIVSAAGGAADLAINDKLRNEAIDYAKDQFGYSLGNIRALPLSLSRVSAFNINNKIFPILEYYTCSDVEKQALRDKITYNGMTVMTIGTIAEYITEEQTYIKGRLIRLEGLDNHTVTEIANELNKGFYI